MQETDDPVIPSAWRHQPVSMASCREGAPIIRLVGADLRGDCRSPIRRARATARSRCRSSRRWITRRSTVAVRRGTRHGWLRSSFALSRTLLQLQSCRPIPPSTTRQLHARNDRDRTATRRPLVLRAAGHVNCASSRQSAYQSTDCGAGVACGTYIGIIEHCVPEPADAAVG